MLHPLKNRLTRFARAEDGSALLLALGVLTLGLMVGGLAVDYSNAERNATLLQNTADSTAHTALVMREFHTADASKLAALATAQGNMPPAHYGNVLKASDITFGTWDGSTWTFTPDSSSKSAVKVTTRRTTGYLNAIPTHLLPLLGVKDLNVTRTAVYRTYYPTCLREGFVANGVVDLQSNNVYQNGFCIHSNSYVSINSNNTFEPGTVVSMPDLSQIQLPNSGYETNTGLKDALRQGSWNIRILKQLPGIISGLKTFDPQYLPSYITNTTLQKLTVRKITQTDLAPGNVYTASCNGGASLTVSQNVVVSDVVLVTDCQIKYDQGVVVKDAVIATTNTGSKSMTSPSGFQVGKNDNCASGGGAQLLTMGSMNFPSDLQIYGSQLIANQDVYFSANANGIQGASIIAGGQISGTSNMNMGFCGTGMEHNFQAEYFRLAM